MRYFINSLVAATLMLSTGFAQDYRKQDSATGRQLRQQQQMGSPTAPYYRQDSRSYPRYAPGFADQAMDTVTINFPRLSLGGKVQPLRSVNGYKVKAFPGQNLDYAQLQQLAQMKPGTPINLVFGNGETISDKIQGVEVIGGDGFDGGSGEPQGFIWHIVIFVVHAGIIIYENW